MISVIIPCYNRSRLLKRAIDSALAQTVRASEIIVVDDGSTDNTRQLCATYGDRIKYVAQKNAGASVARNTGAMLARSSWIAFLDSDDYWMPCHLARMVEAIEKTNGEARFYFSDIQIGEGADCSTLWHTINFAPPHPVQLTKDGTNWVFLARQPTMLKCSVFRKDVWLESGGLDARLHLKHDSELFYRLGIGAKICAVSGIGCVQTEDDISEVRLTTAVDPLGARYWEESIILWKTLIRASRNLAPKYRRIARFRLASLYWRLIRLNWVSGNPWRSVWNLPRLGWAGPFFVMSLLADKRPVLLPEYD